MQEELTKIRSDVLNRLRIERAEVLLEVSRAPEMAEVRRLQNLEDIIATLVPSCHTFFNWEWGSTEQLKEAHLQQSDEREAPVGEGILNDP